MIDFGLEIGGLIHIHLAKLLIDALATITVPTGEFSWRSAIISLTRKANLLGDLFYGNMTQHRQINLCELNIWPLALWLIPESLIQRFMELIVHGWRDNHSSIAEFFAHYTRHTLKKLFI